MSTKEKTKSAHAELATATATAEAGDVAVSVRETWRDWFPDDEPTLTIEEVVDQARGLDPNGMEASKDVTVDRVRYWQRVGVLPAPIRRKRDGSGPGSARALYPEGAARTVALVCELQMLGVPLRKIGPLVKPLPAQIVTDDALREAITTAALHEAQRVGSPILMAEVTFTDARGRKHSYTFGRGQQ